MTLSLKEAVKKLGGPYPAARLYNETYFGKPDPLTGLTITTHLARSTLETWLRGTSTERSAIVAQRLAALAGKSHGKKTKARKSTKKPAKRKQAAKAKPLAADSSAG
jgi:hypothetical protein